MIYIFLKILITICSKKTIILVKMCKNTYRILLEVLSCDFCLTFYSLVFVKKRNLSLSIRNAIQGNKTCNKICLRTLLTQLKT